MAVVRAESGITSLADLKGKRSCHTGFGHTSGWIVPVGSLVEESIIDPDNCNRAQEVAQFFAGSCVPGAADARINSNGSGVESLCSQCIGDNNGSHLCEMSAAERFSGEEGAFRYISNQGWAQGGLRFLTTPRAEKNSNEF